MPSRELALATLNELKAAPVFLQAYQTKRLPENLDIFFGPPEEFFLTQVRDPGFPDPYTEGRRIPILDDGNFGVITFYDPQDEALVQIDIECPGEIQAKFQNWQQFLADLLIQIGESVDDDARVRRMAALVDFHHIDQLFGFFQSYPEHESDDAFQRRKRAFIDRIRD